MKALAPLWFVIALAGACSEALDERSAWLLSSMFQTDRVLLSRDPGPVAQKYALMRTDPYAFLRGTADLFARDVTTPWPELSPVTRFGSAASALVPLVGDPHVENVGSYLAADGTLVLDWNDFDTACYGPYHVDVWRLAVSVELIGSTIGLASGTLSRDVGLAYALAIAEPASGAVREGDVHGLFVDELFEKARKRGEEGRLLNDYAPVGADGLRRLRHADIDVPEDTFWNDTLAPVSDEAADALRALVEAAYPSVALMAQLGSEEPVSVARRLGAGVGSYPLYRYYALFPGPTDEPRDDVLIEVKEVRDPLALAGGALLQPKRYPSNAIRSATLQRELQVTEANDPWLSTGSALGMSFRLRHRTAYQRSIDHADIVDAVADGDASNGDVRALAAILGRLLADAHGRTRTAVGEQSRTAIATAIGGDTTAFADEVSLFAIRYERLLRLDWRRFGDLVETRGETLGLTSSMEGTR